MSDADKTTIQLSKGTRKLLASRGRKGESYEEIILKMMALLDQLGGKLVSLQELYDELKEARGR